ncbi:FIG00638667: hypothetical protein [hydrothermal vent metagenome]|uniref:Periplasmic protein YibQ, distant homology with nucleoside diphosphatase and polysaccharide deacetylase n=1 Tax=hydrothermal vent metagenome TaxID=652676 RepID=A0A3B1E742_9ZZZZ
MSKKKHYKHILLSIIDIIVTICLVAVLYLLVNQFVENTKIQKEYIKELNIYKTYNKQEEHSKYFEEKTQNMNIDYIDEPKKRITTKQDKSIKLDTNKSLPKIVIIIDDVTTLRQVNKIKNIPYPVTISFLPPTLRHKSSANISRQVMNYMIHLPLEAKVKKYEEEETLHIKNTLDQIDERIKKLKKIYPKAKYINNHTGSQFTKNDEAMDKLFRILKKYEYSFIDSRTTAQTVAQKYATKYDVKMFSRNVFLDNQVDKKYVEQQIHKAIKMAYKKGFAIAIGHPHDITLKVLTQSKSLFNGLNVVLIDDLR